VSAALVLPFVWAFAREQAELKRRVETPVEPRMEFYRQYTEAMLEKYLRLSMESGRVPSLLGQEMSPAKVTSCRVGNFDDAVIFIHDVRTCLGKLDREQHCLITRIALQQYTVEETAAFLRLNQRTIIRRFGAAVDCLTRIFLRVKLLDPQKFCQGGRAVDNSASDSY